MKFNIADYKAFIFDFDGVIADSVPVKTEAFAELYKSFGDKIVAYVVQHHKMHGGMSRFLKIRHYHKELLKQDLSEEELMLWAKKFSELVLEKVIQAPFIKGVQKFIHILHQQRKSMFIVTGTPEDEIQRIIREKQLSSYFLEIKGSPRRKDDNLKYLLEKYFIDSHKSVFFGDSPEDFRAASSLGIQFMPINYCSNDIKGYQDFVEFMDKIEFNDKYVEKA